MPKGIGSVIRSPDSPELIDGVRVQPLSLWPDDRGYFLEVQRIGQGLAAAFPPEHYAGLGRLELSRNHQGVPLSPLSDRLLDAGQGLLQVALADLRPGSPTFGAAQHVVRRRAATLAGADPAGRRARLQSDRARRRVCWSIVTDRFYNPADEGRIPYNDPGINYDWETQHK